MATVYAARVVDVPGEGIRLDPTDASAVPEMPNDLNLLAMSVVLALGAAEYEHHPDPRDPQLQTIDALLAGAAVMPWRAGSARAQDGTEPYVVCQRNANGVFVCEVEHRRRADG